MEKNSRCRKLSLRDIAREAGVSISTVSRVLSGSTPSAKISDKTRDRILRVCEKMKFHPNVHYRRLHEGVSRVIGFLFPPTDGDKLFFDENAGVFLSNLERRLAFHGFQIIIQSTTPEFFADRQHLEILRSHTVDGLILWHAATDDAAIREMIQENKPLLKVAFPTDLLPDQIVPDNFQGAFSLTQHLIELGHSHIAHVGGGHTQIDKERDDGYARAMQEAGLQPILFEGEYSYISGYEWGQRIVQTNPGVTAIMAPNDLAAAGCLRRLKDLGIAVPGDMAVTGFDCTSHSEITDPKITTVSLQLHEIGRLCADRIVKAVTDPGAYKPQVTRVPMPVVVNESTMQVREKLIS